MMRVASSRRFVAAMALAMASQRRWFESDGLMDKERGFGHKMRDIPVLTGNPRPVAREDRWTCTYKLSDKMDFVIPDVLRKNGWSDVEIEREMSQIYIGRTVGQQANLNAWTTVEEFQRTPWYRRYRPSDSNCATYISYEAMKTLETALIPPSLREDPYAHLRKRHLEDNFMNDRFSEENASYIRREDLKKYTKGMPDYGKMTRRKFLEFEEKYKAENKAELKLNETYSAWLSAMGGKRSK